MKQLKDKKDKLCAVPHLCILIYSLPCPLHFRNWDINTCTESDWDCAGRRRHRRTDIGKLRVLPLMWMSPTWTSLHMVYPSQQTGLKGSVANVLLSDTRGQKSCKFQALTGQSCFGDIRKIRSWMIFVQFLKKSQPVTYFATIYQKLVFMCCAGWRAVIIHRCINFSVI